MKYRNETKLALRNECILNMYVSFFLSVGSFFFFYVRFKCVQTVSMELENERSWLKCFSFNLSISRFSYLLCFSCVHRFASLCLESILFSIFNSFFPANKKKKNERKIVLHCNENVCVPLLF